MTADEEPRRAQNDPLLPVTTVRCRASLDLWISNLAVSLDDQQTANTLWVNVLDQIYKVSPLAPPPWSTATP